MLDDDIEAELRNPFPSPPSHYQQYSTHNLRLLTLLKSRLAENVSDNGEKKDQHDVLADQKDVPDWPLTQLEKPRVDWTLEEGQYSVFGDIWHVKEKILSLGEYGGQQLYPADPTMDRRPALLSILRSMLVTYSHLLKSMLAPPPNPNSAESPEWQKHVDWLSVMSQNIMSAANDLRPVQARCNLEVMMTRQLELRREETEVIHRKCDDLQRRLSELKVAASSVETKYSNQEDEVKRQKEIRSVPSMQDVFRWAEGA